MINISELGGKKQGEKVSFKGALIGKTVSQVSGGGLMISLEFSDAEASIKFPAFDNAAQLDNDLTIGTPYCITGTVNIWNGNTQIKNGVFRVLSTAEYKPEDFIGVYHLPKPFIVTFQNVIDELGEPYKEFVKVATGYRHDKEVWERFLTCPSAKSNHGNRIGGLFLHTLGVISNVINVLNLYGKFGMYGNMGEVINKDRLITKAIVHDLMKMEEYVYDTCILRKEGCVGHLYEGVGYVDAVNKKLTTPLSEEDLNSIKTSILTHHGEFGPMKPKTLEDSLIHLADMIDSRVVGEMEHKK